MTARVVVHCEVSQWQGQIASPHQDRNRGICTSAVECSRWLRFCGKGQQRDWTGFNELDDRARHTTLREIVEPHKPNNERRARGLDSKNTWLLREAQANVGSNVKGAYSERHGGKEANAQQPRGRGSCTRERDE